MTRRTDINGQTDIRGPDGSGEQGGGRTFDCPGRAECPALEAPPGVGQRTERTFRTVPPP